MLAEEEEKQRKSAEMVAEKAEVQGDAADISVAPPPSNQGDSE